MVKIIKMDLRKSDSLLKQDCDELGIDFEVLKKEKKMFDFYFFLLDAEDSARLFAFIRKGKNDVEMKKTFSNYLLSMSENINSFIEPATDFSESVTFNIDAILDKISDSGINSLTKEERNFLDKQ
jgi:hypothetical protein